LAAARAGSNLFEATFKLLVKIDKLTLNNIAESVLPFVAGLFGNAWLAGGPGSMTYTVENSKFMDTDSERNMVSLIRKTNVFKQKCLFLQVPEYWGLAFYQSC
jgi:hypothetical protein